MSITIIKTDNKYCLVELDETGSPAGTPIFCNEDRMQVASKLVELLDADEVSAADVSADVLEDMQADLGTEFDGPFINADVVAQLAKALAEYITVDLATAAEPDMSSEVDDEGEEAKLLSLDARITRIREAWDRLTAGVSYEACAEMVGSSYLCGWISKVYDYFVIVVSSSHLYRIPYRFVAGAVEFDLDSAEEVEVEYSPVKYVFHMEYKAFGDPDDPDTLLIEGYASTSTLDRVHDRLLPEAFSQGLAAYMKNPIVLFNHNLDRPIGKVIEASIDENGLKVKVAIDKTLHWGKIAASMIEKGILNAFSVRAVNDYAEGFINPDGSKTLVRWDLMEISVVTVPANQEALFSIAKAVEAGTDLINAEQAYTDELANNFIKKEGIVMGTNTNAAGFDLDALAEQIKAKILDDIEVKSKSVEDETKPEVENPVVIPSPDELAAQVLAKMKALQEEEERKRAEAEAERKRIRDEILAELEAERKKNAPPFPVVDFSGSDIDSEAAAQMRELQTLIVGSKYDTVGDLDLLTRYYMQSQAARAGKAPRPSERFYKAVMARAAKFMREEDEVIEWDARPGARPKLVSKPAFDPEVVRPYVAGTQDDTYDILAPDGTVVQRDVQFADNVTAKGVTQLLEIGAKANELIYSTSSGYGDEWVPTLMSAMLWRTIRLQATVLPLFNQFDMPSQPYDYLTEGNDPTLYKVAETTNRDQLVIGANMPITDSKIGTGKVTFNAGKLGALSFWSEEMSEDSIINVRTQFNDQFGITMAHGIDELLVNGDESTGATNISDYGNLAISSNWRLLVLDGLRKQPLAVTTSDARDGGVLDIYDVNATRALMGQNGRLGKDVSQLVIITDVPTSYKFEDLDQVLTIDKYGSRAVILNGQLASVKGIPIVVSEDYPLTSVTGVVSNTATDNIKGSFMVVNRLGIKVGWRRRPRIFVGQVPFSEAWYIMSTARLDIGFFETGVVALNYNVTV